MTSVPLKVSICDDEKDKTKDRALECNWVYLSAFFISLPDEMFRTIIIVVSFLNVECHPHVGFVVQGF